MNGPARTSSSSRLEARELVVRRGANDVVREASLQLFAGELVAIEGASGSGKTSLLRALAQLDPLVAGRLSLDGIDHLLLSPETWRRRVAHVPQQPVVFAGSLADNLATGPGLRGESLVAGQAHELLARVGLGHLDPAREARSLSGGERQRLALARALANTPEFLLLDEPTAALDPESAGHVLALLRRLATDGLGVLLVTHVRAHAALADRHLRCDAGRLGEPAA